jgi:hypothetical protein
LAEDRVFARTEIIELMMIRQRCRWGEEPQAIAEGLDFVTNDEPIGGYPVRMIW